MTAPADALAARYTRDQLRAMCRTRGLPTGGTKAQLAGRLVAPDVTPPVLVRPLAAQADAAKVATTDRQATADHILGVAVTEAIGFLREHRPGRAVYRLARAELSARRVLGEVGAA